MYLLLLLIILSAKVKWLKCTGVSYEVRYEVSYEAHYFASYYQHWYWGGGGGVVRTIVFCEYMSNDAQARIFPKTFVQDLFIYLASPNWNTIYISKK